jgi:hypothetical protein
MTRGSDWPGACIRGAGNLSCTTCRVLLSQTPLDVVRSGRLKRGFVTEPLFTEILTRRLLAQLRVPWKRASDRLQGSWPAFLFQKKECRWALARPSASASATRSGEAYASSCRGRLVVTLHPASAGALSGLAFRLTPSQSVAVLTLVDYLSVFVLTRPNLRVIHRRAALMGGYPLVGAAASTPTANGAELSTFVHEFLGGILRYVYLPSSTCCDTERSGGRQRVSPHSVVT